MKESQLIQQKQFREQFGLINLTKVETVESHKLEQKLDQEIIQLHNSFTTLSREIIMLTYDKYFILTMQQLWREMSVLWDGLTQIQFNFQNVYAYIETLSTSIISPTSINPSDLRYIWYDIKDQLGSHLMLGFPAILKEI